MRAFCNFVTIKNIYIFIIFNTSFDLFFSCCHGIWCHDRPNRSHEICVLNIFDMLVCYTSNISPEFQPCSSSSQADHAFFSENFNSASV